MFGKKKIYFISPVRQATPETVEFCNTIVLMLEDLGMEVFYPMRDNIYDGEKEDYFGANICMENYKGLKNADVVLVYWVPNSEGSRFDLGMAFALHKPLVYINPELKVVELDVPSFEKMMTVWPWGK